MEIAEGLLVEDLGDVVIVDVQTLVEGLGQQPPGGVPGRLEELLRLVEQPQCSRQGVGTLGQVLLDGLQLLADALPVLLQLGEP